MSNGSSEIQESAASESRDSFSYQEDSITEAPLSHQQHVRSMTDQIEPAERPSTADIDILDQSSETPRMFPSVPNRHQDSLIIENPGPLTEPQLVMASRPRDTATSREDEVSSAGWHRNRCCCCVVSERCCCGGQAALSASFPAGCICTGCEIEDEDLEAHMHCMRGCYVFAEIMRRVEPCVKVCVLLPCVPTPNFALSKLAAMKR